MSRSIRSTPTSLQTCREDNPKVFSMNGVCRTQDESSESSGIPDVIFFYFDYASAGASLILPVCHSQMLMLNSANYNLQSVEVD